MTFEEWFNQSGLLITDNASKQGLSNCWNAAHAEGVMEGMQRARSLVIACADHDDERDVKSVYKAADAIHDSAQSEGGGGS